MKRVYVEVVAGAKVFKHIAEAWRRAEAGEKVEPTIGVGSIEELNALVSPKRMELLRYVAQHPQRSVRALATSLGRDYKNVHTDVAELTERRLLERHADGRVTAPFDEIVIRHPLRNSRKLRKAA